MTRDETINTVVEAFNAATGTQAQRIRAALQVGIEAMQSDRVAIVLDEGTRFIRKLTMNPADVIPGRPAMNDCLGFAAAMETSIIATKGEANDPDTKTTPQLIAAARALAVALPALIDAGAPAPVLRNIVRLAAIATVIQARLA